MDRPLIFISGINFVDAKGGLSVRTRLMAEILTDLFRDRKRIMVLAEWTQETIDTLEGQGWEVHLAGAKDGSTSYKLTRFYRITRSRLGLDENADMLWLRGGSIMIDPRVVERLSEKYPTGVFWVYRTDYASFVRFKRPGQKWLIDTNDSVYHLEKAYGWTNVVARTLKWSSDALARHLDKLEAKFLPRYDKVIAIAPKDHARFAKFVPADRLTMYDTCIVLDEGAASGPRTYFAGYLGGDHKGSVECVRALIAIFETEAFRSFTLVVGGKCSQHVSTKAPNIRIVGLVDDSREFWRSVENVILPGVQPTGISVKFQEALASRCRLFINPGGYTWSKFAHGGALVEYETDNDLRHKLTLPAPEVSDGFYEAIRYKSVRAEIGQILLGVGVQTERR